MAPPLPLKFHPNAPKSFADLMAGVDRGHAALRAVPGAQAIPPAFRQMQKNMLPSEILDKYSDMGLFGKTPKGEPVRATLVPSRGRDLAEIKSGRLPKEGRIRLDPESRVPKDVFEAAQLPDRNAARGEYPRISWEEDMGIGSGNEMLSPLQDAMRRARRDPNSNPAMLDINAMSVKPFVASPDPDIHWWSQGPSRGRMLYGALYDMIRAGGHGNAARTLTDINTVRRLGNVASHSAGHGDLGFIGPVSEYSSNLAGPGRPSFSPQLFNRPLTNRPGEETWMRTTMGPDIAAQAMGLNPKDLLNMTPEQIRGLLYAREANFAAASGPKSGSRVSPLRLGDPNVSMYDKAALADVAQNARTYGQDELADAFGPHTLGRQMATEELMLRMMRRGETPEEIVEDIMLRGKEEGFDVQDALRGRYKKGGLVAALQS